MRKSGTVALLSQLARQGSITHTKPALEPKRNHIRHDESHSASRTRLSCGIMLSSVSECNTLGQGNNSSSVRHTSPKTRTRPQHHPELLPPSPHGVSQTRERSAHRTAMASSSYSPPRTASANPVNQHQGFLIPNTMHI